MPSMLKRLRAGEVASRYGNAIAFGTNFTAGMLVFTFLGYQAGKRFGHQDAWTLAGLFLGLAYGGYEVWKIIRQVKEAEPPRPPDEPAAS